MEETNQGMSILSMVDITTMTIALIVMFYHIFKALGEMKGEKDYPETQQYNNISAIMILCGAVALINAVQGQFIYTFIWGVQSVIWYFNLTKTKDRFDEKRRQYEMEQENIDLFENKPTEFTRKKSISEQLDDMLEEAKNEN